MKSIVSPLKYTAWNDPRYANEDYIADLCTEVVMELMRVGCLIEHEVTSQRSSLLILLDRNEDELENMEDLWPFTAQIFCGVINHTTYWSEIQASPVIIRLLKAAVMSGDYGLVALLCLKGVSVHQRAESLSALEIGCGEEVEDVVFQLLLDYADEERLDETNSEDDGLGLLHYLAVPGATCKIVELLHRGANPNIVTAEADGFHTPALVHHLEEGQIESAVILLNNGADPTCTDSRGYDAHVTAARGGAMDFLVALDKAAAATSKWHLDWQMRCIVCINPTTSGKAITIRGCNAFHLSALSGNVDCLSFYKDRSIFSDVNVTTTELKLTPLHCAALSGNTSGIKFLKSQGANINARTSLGELPLHYAVLGEHPNAIEALIGLGSDIAVDKSGISPYMLACQLDNDALKTCFQKTIQHRISDDKSMGSQDILHVSNQKELSLAIALEGAIMDGNTELCQELHQRDCQLDVDIPSCKGCSPLLLAIRHKKVEIIKWLLNHKASTLKISCQSQRGIGPIHGILEDKSLVCVLPLFLERYLSDGGNLLREVASPVYSAVSGNNLKGLQILLEHLQQNAKHYA